ncbi:hypothetical protein B0H11DRAFT_2234437 [Mycena galericulata]|nr:hypothetical protein B0H11DRAFT_2234437 [Mycena galericulata]
MDILPESNLILIFTLHEDVTVKRYQPGSAHSDIYSTLSFSSASSIDADSKSLAYEYDHTKVYSLSEIENTFPSPSPTFADTSRVVDWEHHITASPPPAPPGSTSSASTSSVNASQVTEDGLRNLMSTFTGGTVDPYPAPHAPSLDLGISWNVYDEDIILQLTAEQQGVADIAGAILHRYDELPESDEEFEERSEDERAEIPEPRKSV